MIYLIKSTISLAALVVILTLAILSGCSGSAPATQTPANSPSAAPAATSNSGQSVTINLVAQNMSFDQNAITVPAGADVTINFQNKDTVPHNFAAYTDSSAATSIYVGKIISGPANITYNFKAPTSPGNYFFRCDVHPTTMKGSFVVTAAVSASMPITPAPAPASTNPTTSSAPPPTVVTTPSTAAVLEGPPVTINLTAQKMAFDMSTITVPSGAAVTINFNNKDSGIPHNVSVYQNLAGGQTQPVFIGDTIVGPATITYHFSAPSAPGSYFFDCDVHPQLMNGQFIVTSN